MRVADRENRQLTDLSFPSLDFFCCEFAGRRHV